jgi:dihydropteroate synthase
MGILNCTPDSFYDGGRHSNESLLLQQVEKMLAEGADFIDVGAYSSKPNAEFITPEEELKRITPVIELILKNFPDAIISADTFRANVAKACIDAGGCHY